MSPQPPRPSAGGNPEPPPLPRGRHRLPFEVVVENQRRRLIAGAARALVERGYTELSVRHVIEAAAVSRSTFYANFDNKHDCVLAGHRYVFERFERVILRACAAELEWPQRVKAAIAAVFAFVAEAPEQARLLTLDALAADLEIARAVIDSNARLASLLREGRHHAPHGPDLPELVEEAMVAGAWAVLGGRLFEGGLDALPALEPEVVQLVLTPYVGVQEAARIARSDVVGANGRDPGRRP